MKKIIVEYTIITVMSVLAFFMLYSGASFIGIEVLSPIALIIGLTWWLACNNQQELMDEIKDLKKEIKELKDKK